MAAQSLQTFSTREAGLGRRGENLSIMIPTFNCAHYLAATLQSVAEQGDSIRDAEIVVVDDASMRDDPETVLRQFPQLTVKLFRQPKNLGPTANFNSCISLATRSWIQILHGDDIALPDAYVEFNACLEAVPQSQVVFGRCVYLTADGLWNGMTVPLGDKSRGSFAYDPIAWSTCRVQFAGVLVHRDAFAAVGNFDSAFQHVADWNLWWRLSKTNRVAYTNACVGGYRLFAGNHTSTLRRSGANLREIVEQTQRVLADVPPPVDEVAFWQRTVQKIVHQCESFAADPQAAANCLAIFDELPAEAVPWHLKPRLCRRLAKLRWQHAMPRL